MLSAPADRRRRRLRRSERPTCVLSLFARWTAPCTDGPHCSVVPALGTGAGSDAARRGHAARCLRTLRASFIPAIPSLHTDHQLNSSAVFAIVHQGSRRRTTANAPAKIYDLDSHYAALAFGLTEMSKLPTDDEVKDAWRRRMREVHPDVPGGSTDKASRVNQAFEALETGA
jgi:hypothetical protein